MSPIIPFLFLLFFLALIVLGRSMKAREEERERLASAARVASALAGSMQRELFNAIHSTPQFKRPVLVWLCPHCDLYAFVAQDCPRCHVPMPETASASWAIEADIMTQGTRKL